MPCNASPLRAQAFARPFDPAPLLAALAGMQYPGRSAAHPLRLMEVCGTHTMAIAKSGLKSLLPPTVQLISGPGCPVCVTPAGAVDEFLRIAMLPGVATLTYGDLLRVPGSVPGTSLSACRAAGADVRIVYSAMDCLALAKAEPQTQFVFLGVGFETTAPGTAALVLAAAAAKVTNLSVLSLLKTTTPAVTAILGDPACAVDGLLCPGHVATIVGAEAFRFVPEVFRRPAVVAGFEAGDILAAVYELCRQCAAGEATLINEYTRAVRPTGNPVAAAALQAVFAPADDVWRGLGSIPASGLKLRDEYAAFNAAARYGFAPQNKEGNTGCRCGEILRGQLAPTACPLFGTRCTPADPVGPCMVSGEGACAAAYKYRSV